MKHLLILLALGIPWFSAKPDIFTINSANYNDGHYYVGPYNSSLNGTPVTSFCVDFTDHVGFGQPFDVTLVNLANFQGPLHDNYWEAGWIALQMQGITDVNSLSVMQTAIWLITTPGTSDPYLTTSGAFLWATAAAQNYQSVDQSLFTIAIRTGDEGQNQLLIGQVPEPGVGITLVGAFGILFFLHRIRRENA